MHKALKEAFPQVPDNIIHGMLVAAGGDIEAASNGILAMGPPLPPRPVDDELARIGNTISRGWQETRKQFTTFFTDIKKNLSDEPIYDADQKIINDDFSHIENK